MENFPIHVFHRGDSALPAELWQIAQPPEKIYVQGSPEALELLSRLPRDGLAVVGTRNPQPRSLHETRRVLGQLEGSLRIIVSGFARGIDGEAHQCALDFGLPTLAILGSGFGISYPAEHQSLRSRLLSSGGLLVTEFAPDQEPRPGQFLKRNRIIAGWARATWVVAASYRSGAMNTAKWARELGRDIFATPCFPGDPSLAGNQELLDRLEARPLWGRFSLGSTWLELSTPSCLAQGRRARDATSARLDFPVHGNSNPDDARDLSDARELSRLVQAIEARLGAAVLQDVFDGALALGWSPARFYDAADLASRLGWIRSDDLCLRSGTGRRQGLQNDPKFLRA